MPRWRSAPLLVTAWLAVAPAARADPPASAPAPASGAATGAATGAAAGAVSGAATGAAAGAVVGATAGAADRPCDAPGVTTRLGELLRARRYADAHHAADGLRVLCGEVGDGRDAWRLIDDVALLRLEDRPWALSDLDALAAGGPVAERARVVLAWAYLTSHDAQPAAVRVGQLPPARAAAVTAATALDDDDAFATSALRLPPEVAARARALHARYAAATHERRPAVAGVLSALLPGAGQLYAGSPQAAAVTFVLNALFIGATVELARDHQYWTATAAGTVGSVFYIGGVINAVDLARRRDQLAAQPDAESLEELLLPELSSAP